MPMGGRFWHFEVVQIWGCITLRFIFLDNLYANSALFPIGVQIILAPPAKIGNNGRPGGKDRPAYGHKAVSSDRQNYSKQI